MNAYLGLTKRLKSNIFPDKLKSRPSQLPREYEEICKKFSEAMSDPAQNRWYSARYEEYVAALTSELPSDRISCAEMKSNSTLLVGHGGTSVLETSLMLHRIYGVPYIPGTALKGLTAHYCHHVLGEEEYNFRPGGDYDVAVFGSTDHGGLIEFHDAWITPDTVSNSLVQDVMTPHHQAYNSIRLTDLPKSNEVSAPRDDDDPVPISFIGAKGTFRTILTCSASNVSEEHAAKWLAITREILNHALEHEGIGAKTNAGYGRLKLAGGSK